MKDAKGFTLIETLVGLAIFSIAATAVSALLMLAFITANTNSSRAHAADLAVQEIEDLRSERYNDLASRLGSDDWQGTTFAILTQVQGNVPAANMSTVTVTVSYPEYGKLRSYVSRTIFTDVQR